MGSICIKRYYAGNKIVGYRIQDSRNSSYWMDIDADELKEQIASGQSRVDNLKLTSDGRLLVTNNLKDEHISQYKTPKGVGVVQSIVGFRDYSYWRNYTHTDDYPSRGEFCKVYLLDSNRNEHILIFVNRGDSVTIYLEKYSRDSKTVSKDIIEKIWKQPSLNDKSALKKILRLSSELYGCKFMMSPDVRKLYSECIGGINIPLYGSKVYN